MRKIIAAWLAATLLLMIGAQALAEYEGVEIQEGVVLGMTEEALNAVLGDASAADSNQSQASGLEGAIQGILLSNRSEAYNGSRAFKVIKVDHLPGRVAGDGSAEYAIDGDGKLFAATLTLGNMLLMSPAEYGNSEQKLVDRYGNPDNSWLKIASELGYEPLGAVLQYFDLGADPVSELDRYSSWLVPVDDANSAVVSHYYLEVLIIPQTGAKCYFNIVGYQLYDNEALGI